MTPSAQTFVIDNCRHGLVGKKILLGVTGSIAAYKTPELVRLLKKAGAEVRVVLTPAGKNFVAPLALSTVSESPVMESMWSDAIDTHHITAARWADLLLIAPATANVIAKLANGICDDLLTTESLAFTGPILIAPAMNPAMWSAAATQENVARLKNRGVQILGPAVGETSCKEEGAGRMIEPIDLLIQVAMAASAADQKTQSPTRARVLLTLGPTRSFADPVRFLTNRSSGKMGAALAWAALFSNCDITCIVGPTDIELPPVGTPRVRVLRVDTATEMHRAAMELWPHHDLFIGTAAVLDWEFSTTETEKIKKQDSTSSEQWQFTLRTAPDILKGVSQAARADQFTLGFAAETNDVIRYARTKRVAKTCDAIFANDVSSGGFESDTNEGVWIDQFTDVAFAAQKKTELAAQLLVLALQKWHYKKSLIKQSQEALRGHSANT